VSALGYGYRDASKQVGGRLRRPLYASWSSVGQGGQELVDRHRTRISRLATWSAVVVIGAFVVVACRPEEATPEPTEVPASVAASEAPATAAPATEGPSTAPIVGSIVPTEAPATEAPTLAPTAPPPTEAPATEAPTLTPTAPPPTEAPATEAPTLTPTAPPPTEAPATEAPTLAPTAPPPTEAPATEAPTLAPTAPPPTEAPATEAPTLAPTAPPPTEAPATIVPAASATAEATAVSGTIVLPEGAVLPAGATWTVAIQDTSVSDAVAATIGETSSVVADPAAAEFEFEVPYDASLIDAAATYTLHAVIEDATQQALYVDDTATPVITGGAPTTGVTVEVVEATLADAAASMAAAMESAAP
jgi:uncharacterized lipoprotein YbaY